MEVTYQLTPKDFVQADRLRCEWWNYVRWREGKKRFLLFTTLRVSPSSPGAPLRLTG